MRRCSQKGKGHSIYTNIFESLREKKKLPPFLLLSSSFEACRSDFFQTRTNSSSVGLRIVASCFPSVADLKWDHGFQSWCKLLQAIFLQQLNHSTHRLGKKLQLTEKQRYYCFECLAQNSSRYWIWSSLSAECNGGKSLTIYLVGKKGRPYQRPSEKKVFLLTFA